MLFVDFENFFDVCSSTLQLSVIRTKLIVLNLV